MSEPGSLASGQERTILEVISPELVARIEFLEWTEADYLRHAKFAGLREDKKPRSVVKELLLATSRRDDQS